MQKFHATSVNIDGRGVLLRGPSGAGKSDLALRLIDVGAKLIADDQTEISQVLDRLLLNSPAPIAGKIEIRGFGISQMPYDENIKLFLIVDLRELDDIERMPEKKSENIMGCDIAIMQLHAFEISAVAKIHAVLRGLDYD